MRQMKFILIATLFISTVERSFAQEDPNAQLLLIHEDDVIVSKTSEYMEASQGFVNLMSENNFAGTTFTAFRMDDYTFMYVSPIENMAQLDDNQWAGLSEKVGKDKFETVMSAFDGTYDTHRDFIAVYHPDLSYKPEQLQEEGNNYREWMYLYYNQAHQDKVMDMAKEWKKLYTDNNIPAGYTIYSNGLGHEGPVLVVHSWAKNPTDHAQGMEKRNESMGDKASALWERTEALAYKIVTKTGWLVPDISYNPGQ